MGWYFSYLPKITVCDRDSVFLSCIGNDVVLDCEAQECVSLDGSTPLDDKLDDALQYLPPGDSAITWTGTVTKLVVTPNWRYL